MDSKIANDVSGGIPMGEQPPIIMVDTSRGASSVMANLVSGGKLDPNSHRQAIMSDLHLDFTNGRSRTKRMELRGEVGVQHMNWGGGPHPGNLSSASTLTPKQRAARKAKKKMRQQSRKKK